MRKSARIPFCCFCPNHQSQPLSPAPLCAVLVLTTGVPSGEAWPHATSPHLLAEAGSLLFAARSSSYFSLDNSRGGKVVEPEGSWDLGLLDATATLPPSSPGCFSREHCTIADPSGHAPSPHPDEGWGHEHITSAESCLDPDRAPASKRVLFQREGTYMLPVTKASFLSQNRSPALSSCSDGAGVDERRGNAPQTPNSCFLAASPALVT